jgi:protein-L-isoaspartate(D-aspartate) O-methyltransferase
MILSLIFSFLLLSCGADSSGTAESQQAAEEDAAAEASADETAAADESEAEEASDTEEAEETEAAETAEPEDSEDGSELPPPAYDITRREDGPPTGTFDAYKAWIGEHTPHEEPWITMRWERAQAALVHYDPPDITHERVLKAFLRTPREYFCREWNLDRAYIHNFMSIGYGVTISGPHIVARMTDVLNPQPDEKVLEIGTGSGYQAAFLAELSNYVYTIEIIEPLAKETDALYDSYEETHPQYKNVKRKIGDGYYGWEEYAPFDKIIVTAGIDHIPPPLIQQLAVGGEMVIPVGPPSVQQLLHVTKTRDEEGNVILNRRDIYEGTGRVDKVQFVPFTSEGGTGVHSKQ